MKKIIILSLLAVFSATSLCYGDIHGAGKRMHIIDYFDEQGIIDTHIYEIKDSSRDETIDLELLKSEIEKGLTGRINHTFNIAPSEKSADIAIDIEITEYFWTTVDPVDMVFSPIVAVIDKLSDDNYARMQMDIKITDVKTGKELWRETIQSTITDDTMTKEESYDRSRKRIAKNFIRKLFKKPERR